MNRRGIRHRVLALAFIPLILVATGLSAYFMNARYTEMERNLEDKSLALAGQLAKACEFALFSGDLEALARLVRPLFKPGEIEAISVMDGEARLLFTLGGMRPPRRLREDGPVVVERNDQSILVVAPVVQQPLAMDEVGMPASAAPMGYVALTVSRQATRERQRVSLITGLAIAAMGLTLAGMLAWRLGRDIVRPLGMLTEGVERIAAGDLNVRVKVDSGGEFAVLEHGFNHMASELKASYDTLQEKIRAATARLTWQASHDALTGLPNRAGFDEALRQAWAATRHDPGDRHCLLYLDLDQFKVVNDTSGHQAGDELLRQLSARMRQTLRGSDVVARLGGDEFGILLSHCDATVGLQLAEKLRRMVESFRFHWNDRIYQVGSSIGLVEIDAVWADTVQLMSAADAACYAAKDAGRNQVQVFRPGDEDVARRRGEMEWVGRLSRAMEDDRLSLHYQPLVPLGEGASQVHHELLLRLADGEEDILPMAFIPAAERYQLMPRLDRWVVEHVLGLCDRQVRPPTPEGSLFGINLSGLSLGDERFRTFLREAMGRHPEAATRICFEITETAAMNNLDAVLDLIRDLKALGCRFALDDFGSGLSSFAYLQNLDVDFIKIDGTFVRDMARDPVDAAMVEAIAKVAKIMGIRTVAEFVEDGETAELLRHLGVDYAQGNHFGPPRPLAGLCAAEPVQETTW